MKISVSLPDDDVAFLDEYVAHGGTSSRSAVLHQAIGLLRATGLEDAYDAAWNEWDASEDAAPWNATISDGMGDAAG
jgi:Arc/MetJ-type ribon-helix-helix transcriptional regulator